MKDLEYYLAYPFRWLAEYARVTYDGEWRNGQAAHVMGGWALAMTAMRISKWLLIPVLIYPIVREIIDGNKGRKTIVDLITFYFGETIGILLSL